MVTAVSDSVATLPGWRRAARLADRTWSRQVERMHRHVLPRLGRRVVYLAGFSAWKHAYLRRYLSSRSLVFLPPDLDAARFAAEYREEMLARRGAEIYVWGVQAPDFLLAFARHHRLPLSYVEDGFIRSAALGASKSVPMSLCIDARAPYFDARRPSDLEVLLGTHDFTADRALMRRAERGIELLLDSGVSKYNNTGPIDLARQYGPKTARRVLVLGQVEDDASIRCGCDRPLTNNDVVRLATAENPHAQILYKPHPDVLGGLRPAQSNPDDVRALCRVIDQPMPLAQALSTIDHVYTISSLAGFEALLRGIPVTTLGCPFYAGWGLTDDRQPNPRRQRRLSLRELFAAAYLLYPRYFDPASGAPSTFEAVVARLRQPAPPQPVPRRAAGGSYAPWPGPARNALSLYVP